MKIFGKYLRKLTNESKDIELTLSVSNWQSKKLLEELNKDENYKIEINVVKSKRSLEQNKMMWALISEIADKMNNDRDEMWVYCYALEKCNAKYEYMKVLPQAEDMLRKQFRAVRFIREEEEQSGKIFNIYKVYYGSSKFNVKEMKELIDQVLILADKCGIDTSEYN